MIAQNAWAGHEKTSASFLSGHIAFQGVVLVGTSPTPTSLASLKEPFSEKNPARSLIQEDWNTFLKTSQIPNPSSWRHYLHQLQKTPSSASLLGGVQTVTYL